MPMLSNGSNVIPLPRRAWSATTPASSIACAAFPPRRVGESLGVDGQLARVLRPPAGEPEDPVLLREALAGFRDLFERAPFGLLVMDLEGGIRRASAMAAAILGRDASTLQGMSFADLCRPDDRAQLQAHLRGLASGADFDVCELDLIGAGQGTLPVQVATLNVGDAPEGPLRAALFDASGLREIEAGLSLAASVVEHSSQGIMVTDAQYRVIAVNPAYTAITALSAEEMLGQVPQILRPGPDADGLDRAIGTRLHDQDHWHGETNGHRKGGDPFPQWVSIDAVRDPDGVLTHYVWVVSDLTDQEESKRELRELAYSDALTGLANRASLLDQLSRSLITARREKHLVGLLYLDLDGFKEVNDTLGHAVGDRLLQFVGGQLRAAVRHTDLVARIGGDELTILAPGLNRDQSAGLVAANILKRLAENPFREDAREIYVGASIGIALFPKDAQDSEGLLACADTAMYAAKRAGRNTFRFHSAVSNPRLGGGNPLEVDLRRAQERNELALLYEPQVCLKTFRVVGCEARMCWNHAARGPVDPGTFLPLAEKIGLLAPFTRWALDRAAAQTRPWRDRAGGVRVAMDLSPAQLGAAHFDRLIALLAARAGAFSAGLELEIDEAVLTDCSSRCLEAGERIRALGIGIALDNVGRGPSPLLRIKQFPLTRLKLDTALLRNVDTDPKAAALVQALIDLGHRFGLNTLAQGVETSEQLNFLRTHGCDAAQGPLLSQPLRARPFGDLLQRSSILRQQDGAGDAVKRAAQSWTQRLARLLGPDRGTHRS